jgi:uncharacterized protein
MPHHWSLGSVVLQEGWSPVAGGKLIEVRPAIVVDDNERYLALYFPFGTTYLSGDTIPGRGRYALSLEERTQVYLDPQPLTLEQRQNRTGHVLSLLPSGALHAVWLFWDSEWSFRSWYVNLQAPLVRTARGIQVTDCYLDLTVTPDFEWRWKDQDEFAAMCAAGALSPEMSAAIRKEGEQMAARIENRGWPFNEPWPAWRPDPAWRLPVVGDGWGPRASVASGL